MKKYFLIGAILGLNLLQAQIPNGYYDGTDGLAGAELKTKLSQIITNGHQDKGYGGLWTAYYTTDIDTYYENDGTILDIYSENPSGADPYNYMPGQNQCGNYKKEGDCYNREHIIPQSLFSEKAPMVSDIHHIRATDGYVNNRRSNYPFGKVGTSVWTSKNGSKLGNSVSEGYGGTVFEPIDEFKGDVARMFFYFVTRYENNLSTFSSGDMLGGSKYPGLEDWFLKQMLAWHQQDPVSQAETDRNNASYNFQKNRNPYIDHPEWVAKIWGEISSMGTDENIDRKSDLKLYPTPVKDGILKVQGGNLSSIAKAEIYDIDGRLVKSVEKPFQGKNYINVNHLKSGVYILKLNGKAYKFLVK